jgi:hypothetical protein
MSSSPLLFSVEEAFMRLAQMKSRGCLLVFNKSESVQVFVQDGAVVAAILGDKTGEEALDRAMALEESAYRWMPEAEPVNYKTPINIQDYISRRSQAPEARFKTIKMAVYEKRETKLDFQYFFVPEETPTSKLRVKKATSVLGREGSCDLYIESFQVSRRHCLVEVTERGVQVKDLDSTNGTFINGQPTKDGYINEGDRLSLGTYVLTLRREKV